MTPKMRPLNFFLKKMILKNDSKINSALPPSSADLITSVTPTFSARLLASHSPLPAPLAIYPRSQRFPELPRARVRGSEKPRGVKRSTEKAGATDGIQSAEDNFKEFFKALVLKFHF